MAVKTFFSQIRFPFFILFLLLALAVSSPVRAAEVSRSGKPEFTFKLAAVAPEGTSWADTGAKFRKYVEENSGGRVRVTWYLGQAMGDEPDEIRKIHLGQLQGGGFTNVGLAIIVPETRILGLPFLFRDYDEIDFILKKMSSHFQKLFESRGFVLAGWLEVGFNYWFSQKPIAALEDFKSCKMWAWTGDIITTELNQVLGFQNVPVAFPEVLTSLQTGLLNSFYGPLYAIVALQWYTQTRYLIDLPFSYTPAAIAMDRRFLDDLPPDLRKIIMDGWSLYLPDLVTLIRQDNQKAYKGLVKKNQLVRFDATTVQKIKETTYPLYQKYSDQLYPSWLLSGILNALQEYRMSKETTP